MKSLILILTLMISSSSFAIRHVGSGGGESELLLWQYSEFLSQWAQGCNTNPDLCWNGGVLSADFQKSISNLKLNFVNADESAAMCGAGQLTLTHEELYRDHDRNSATPEVSKSETDLALILIKSLLVCQGSNANDLQNLTMTMLPKGRLLSNQGILVLEGTATDMIFLQGSSRNLHAELTAKMQCDQYKVASADSNGFLVQCKTKQETYLVTPQQQNGELVLNVRYNSEVDF
jgi:hypothetical protein